MRLKIVIFDGSFKTTPFINRLVQGLAVNHQVYILGFNEKLKSPIPGVRYIALGSNQNRFRFMLTTFKYLLRSKQVGLWVPSFKKFIRGERLALQQQNLNLALSHLRPDLIHLQWPSVIPWFEEVLTEQQPPVVLSQRGFHNNVRPFVDPLNFEYLQKWYPKIAGFHSVSKAMSATGDKLWKSPKKLDKVVYTGIALGQLVFSENYRREKPLQLLSIGRAHWIKGYDEALLACKILKEKNEDFRYTIIGGAGDEELQFLIADLGLTENVALTPRLPQRQVFQQMAAASVLLMPSLEEGIPNVVVEAMAIGLPVISTNCGGVPELIENKVNGWLVPIRDPAALAEAISSFVALPLNEIQEVRSAARKKVEEQHALELMVGGMEGLYSEVVDFKKS
jgi:colanic acid/amylovoran biosynthesis glycosyltransferase